MRLLLTFTISIVISVASVAAIAADVVADNGMEIVLIEHLPDEARGWCIDAAGHQQGAIMEGGVHGHTCYSYENKGIAVDQGFDADGVEKGYFRLTAFDHCLTMSIPESESWIALTPCDGREAQKFEMKDDGQIVSLAAPGLCVTLGLDIVPGGGGTPIHQIRTATLDTCSDDKAIYQKWRLRDHKDW
jgi:hypothetical protein